MISFNSKFHLSLTEISVQGAPVSLACWVGIPVYLVLIVSFIYHTLKYHGSPDNYDRLKYQSRKLLSPLLAGLESQFIKSNVNSKLNNYHGLKYQSRELLYFLPAGLESQFI